jgi:hypothetical protein
LSMPSRSICRTWLSLTPKRSTINLRECATPISWSWASTRARKISLRRVSVSCWSLVSSVMALPFCSVSNRENDHTRKPRSLASSGEIGGCGIWAGTACSFITGCAMTLRQWIMLPTSGDARLRVRALDCGGIPASQPASRGFLAQRGSAGDLGGLLVSPSNGLLLASLSASPSLVIPAKMSV